MAILSGRLCPSLLADIDGPALYVERATGKAKGFSL
jgi:hypothetical protein